jgi:hypothetical protein
LNRSSIALREAISFPIDVVEPKAPNLARAQPVDSEQKQNGAVTWLKWLVPRVSQE